MLQVRCRGLVVAGIGLSTLACRPVSHGADHPDDPVNATAPPPSSGADAPAPPPKKTEPEGPGVAYLHAEKIALVREAVPCPDDCARGEARMRCGVAPDIRFLDLVAKGSHREVRSVLEGSRGIDACFAAIADASAKRVPKFRIPLDFVIGPDGRVQSREDPLHEPDPELEQMLACVGAWLDGLTFEGGGIALRTRVRLQVEPVGTCASPD